MVKFTISQSLFLVFVFSVLIFITPCAKAQLTTSTALTPAQLVQTVLLGGGVTATNIIYNGVPLAIGKFSGPSNIGLASGVILATGAVSVASGPNNVGNAYSGGSGLTSSDPELSSIATNTLYDAAILEFDFVPVSDTVKFNYVFGSEEYIEFAPSSYNDVFGFFISGLNPSGGAYTNQNIALIPGTTSPVSINNINTGTNPAYYFDNGNGYGSGTAPDGLTIQYDGFTVPLTAIAPVLCGSTYHIKIAISDVGDGIFDSGVFLEAGSFASSGGTQNCVLVWPGDSDHNYVVDNNDLLPIGLYYGQMGIARNSISNLWQGDTCSNWGAFQTNGSDIKHVDSNGDGVIDNSDTLAINLNFNLTHAFAPAISDIEDSRQLTPIYIVTPSNYYNSGNWVNAEVWLGNITTPVNNLYGISFNIQYDASMVQPGTEMITFPNNTWLGTIGTDAIKFAKIDPLISTAYGAITNINHTNKNGYGKIADFKFQIKTTLIGASAIHLSISNYKANDSAGVAQVFQTQIDSVLINQVTGITDTHNAFGISIYPNPFTFQTTIEFAEEQKSCAIKIMDVFGKTVKTINFNGKQVVIEKEEMHEGIYFIQMLDENKNIVNKKIVISK